jgi:hypothetical protein
MSLRRSPGMRLGGPPPAEPLWTDAQWEALKTKPPPINRWVKPTTIDGTGGDGSFANPWTSLKHAAEQCQNLSGEVVLGVMDCDLSLLRPSGYSEYMSFSAKRGASNPIWVVAQNERQAILRTGGKRAIKCRGTSSSKSNWASHIYFHGITCISAEDDNVSMPHGIFFNEFTTDIRYIRCLGSDSNTYANEQHVFHNQSTERAYYEECEALNFHRHGISLYRTQYSAALRNYVNSRRESSGITTYRANYNLVADNIIEGRAKFPNQCDDRSSTGTYPGLTAHHNLWNQNILFGAEFINPNARLGDGGTHEGNEWHHMLLIDTYRSVLSESDHGKYYNFTVHNTGAGNSHPALMMDDFRGDPGNNLLVVKNWQILNSPYATYQETDEGSAYSATRDLSHCNLHGNAGADAWDTGKTLQQNVTRPRRVAQGALIGAGRVFQDTTTTDPYAGSIYGWGAGKTLVWVPTGQAHRDTGSTAHKKYDADGHKGASILYRTEAVWDANGHPVRTVSDKPLWRPSDGMFPRGAKVAGVNDFDNTGSWNFQKNVYNVHERLFLNTVTLPYNDGSGKTNATFDARISAGANDTYRSNSTVDATHTYFGGGKNGTTVRRSAGLWENVTIPKDAEILSAYIELVARNDRGGDAGTECNLLFSAQAADTVTALPTTSTEWDAVSRTMSQVAWFTVERFYQDQVYRTPDLSIIIQELVKRANWASGNGLALFVEDNGSTELSNSDRYGYSYNGANEVALNPNYAPRLIIEYRF